MFYVLTVFDTGATMNTPFTMLAEAEAFLSYAREMGGVTYLQLGAPISGPVFTAEAFTAGPEGHDAVVTAILPQDDHFDFNQNALDTGADLPDIVYQALRANPNVMSVESARWAIRVGNSPEAVAAQINSPLFANIGDNGGKVVGR